MGIEETLVVLVLEILLCFLGRSGVLRDFWELDLLGPYYLRALTSGLLSGLITSLNSIFPGFFLFVSLSLFNEELELCLRLSFF